MGGGQGEDSEEVRPGVSPAAFLGAPVATGCICEAMENGSRVAWNAFGITLAGAISADALAGRNLSGAAIVVSCGCE